MKTASVQDLRYRFSIIERWLSEGEDILIEKKGQPFAVLHAGGPPLRVKPDFAARRRAIWGDRVFTEAEVAEMRSAEVVEASCFDSPAP